VFYHNPTVPSGGVLDLDSNAECEIDHKNNENITWSNAPEGTYTVRLDYWDSCGTAKTNYVVTVHVPGRQAQVFNGYLTGTGDQGDSGAGTLIMTFGVGAGTQGGSGKVTEQPKDFKDCQDVGNWLNAGNPAGVAHWVFDYQTTSPVVTGSDKDGYTASTEMTFMFSAARSSITLTVPRWPNMTQNDKAAVRKFVELLLEHEQGHFQVVKDFVATADTKVTGQGVTRQKAAGSLKEMVNKRHQQVHQELQRKQDDYDAKTNHGLNQVAVGGRNVELNCP
jgi:hypothetical protein